MLSDFDPSAFFSSGVLLDLSHMSLGQSIDDEDLEAAEEAAGLAVREGEIVIIQTALNEPTLNRSTIFPTLSRNGVEYLEFKHVAAVGVDAPSVDRRDAEPLEVHMALFERDLFVIENLCNLGRLDESRFRLVALPLNLRGGVAPARIIAILE